MGRELQGAALVIQEKVVTHGESRVDYGNERPKYRALSRRIDLYYRDLLRPLEALHARLETMLGLPEVAKDDSPFSYNRARQRQADLALEAFLTELAGPDRSEEGFVKGGIESDTADGIIQQQNVLSFATGLQRGSDLLNRGQTLQAGRNNPATEKMLENAFQRLSVGGQMRLEEIKDEIHGVLAGGAEAGLNPLEVARQLSKQFDQYSSYEFQRLARTEAAYASEEGVRGQLEAYGVTAYQILVDAGACPICIPYANQIIEVGGDLPPYHIQCLCTVSPAGIGEMLL